jgi:hypothetical protein
LTDGPRPIPDDGPDPEKPEPEKPDPAQLEGVYSGARDLVNSEDLVQGPPAPQAAADVPGLTLLTSLLSATIFTDLLHYRAITRLDHPTHVERIASYCDDHPKLDKFCLVSDLICRWVVTLMILAALGGIIGGTIYRTFFM